MHWLQNSFAYLRPDSIKILSSFCIIEGHKSPEIFWFWSLCGLPWFGCWVTVPVNVECGPHKAFHGPAPYGPSDFFLFSPVWITIYFRESLIYASSYKLNPRGIGPFHIRSHPLQNTDREIQVSEKQVPLTKIWYVLHALYEYKWMVKSKRKFKKLLIIYLYSYD